MGVGGIRGAHGAAPWAGAPREGDDPASGASARDAKQVLLERADVGGDRPPVVRRHARAVGIHDPEAIGDRVEEELRRGLHQHRLRAGRRTQKAQADDRAVAVALIAMTGRAEDAEPLLAALEQRGILGSGRRFPEVFGIGRHWSQATPSPPAASGPLSRWRRTTAGAFVP